MTDIKDTAADQAEKDKSGRRASLARALHVPNISRRIKQFEQTVSDHVPSTDPVRPKETEVDGPDKNSEPTPTPSVASRETGRADEDIGGAEIPDIPLRRSSNTVNAAFTASSLNTLERILIAGGMQNGQHPGPLSFHPFQPNAEKQERLDGQYHVPDERSLYPVTECSWESSQSDDSDVSDQTSIRRDAAPSPRPQQRGLSASFVASPARQPLTDDNWVQLATSPLDLRAESSFDRERAPTMLAESRSASSATRTSFQTFQTFETDDQTVQTDDQTVQTDDQSSIALPALQVIGVDNRDALQPVGGNDPDPHSFDLVVPPCDAHVYSLEHRSELLFSTEHMRVIISDPILLHRFSSFLVAYRPQSVPLLNYTLDALKAIRAMEYVNDIISSSLRPDSHQAQHHLPAFAARAAPDLTENESLRQKTAAAFEALAKDDLPAYITHIWIDIAELSMRRKIMGLMPKNLQYLSEGLAEVFCITDPSRKDNPIVFASEEFHRTTQYGPDYALGRNCRFLQGPKTNPFSIQRIKDAIAQGKEHHETFLNYRRDGLPFMNLLMTVPLLDSQGQVRYFLGAQIDVSGLAKDCSGLESLRKLVDQDEEQQRHRQQQTTPTHDSSRSRSLSNLSDTTNTTTTTTTHPRRQDSGINLSAPILVGTAPITFTGDGPTRSVDNKPHNEFRLLAEMLSRSELETVRRFGGRMHRSQHEQGQHLAALGTWHKPRVVLCDAYEPSPPSSPPVPQQGFDSYGRSVSGPRHVVSDAHGNINIIMPTNNPTHTATGGDGGSGGSGMKARATFENYLVVRPYPSLKILFASRTLRVPGILQSHLMSRIGGSRRIHSELEEAFRTGQSVTAKVKWISGGGALRGVTTGEGSSSGASSTGGTVFGGGRGGEGGGQHDAAGQEGRPRWIHCTPLLGADGGVGVWVVVVVDDDDGEAVVERKRAPRKEVVRQLAPPVAPPGWTMGMGGSRFGQAPGGGGSVMDDMSLIDYRMSDEEPHGVAVGWDWEREREKAWNDRREESQRSDMRLRNEDNQRSDLRQRNEDSQRSDMRVKDYATGQGGKTTTTITGGTGLNGKNNSDSKPPRKQKGETNGITPSSSMDRAMGTISSARSMLLSPKTSAGVETQRQEKEKGGSKSNSSKLAEKK